MSPKFPGGGRFRLLTLGLNDLKPQSFQNMLMRPDTIRFGTRFIDRDPHSCTCRVKETIHTRIHSVTTSTTLKNIFMAGANQYTQYRSCKLQIIFRPIARSLTKQASISLRANRFKRELSRTVCVESTKHALYLKRASEHVFR